MCPPFLIMYFVSKHFTVLYYLILVIISILSLLSLKSLLFLIFSTEKNPTFEYCKSEIYFPVKVKEMHKLLHIHIFIK